MKVNSLVLDNYHALRKHEGDEFIAADIGIQNLTYNRVFWFDSDSQKIFKSRQYALSIIQFMSGTFTLEGFLFYILVPYSKSDDSNNAR